ncbi:MAG: hypothetical protein OEY56_07590 [Cyclobacteriaceae bacterium]|nr:hypothetical protein [Cyclobacteriaceae bacterium]
MSNNFLVPLIIFSSLFGTIILFTRTLTEYLLRKRLIEKGMVDKDSVNILSHRAANDSTWNALKWGLVSFFAGASLILIGYIEYDTNSPLPFGIFITSVSLGFLLYFLIAHKKTTQNP